MRPIPGDSFFCEFRSLQKHTYSVIFENVFGDQPQTQLAKLCANRCEKLFAPYDIYAEEGADIEYAYSLLNKVGGHVSLKVVKTWLNGWATSHRMHEDPILECVLGCKDAPDSLSHYISCPHLFALRRFLFDGISGDPSICFGIKSPRIFSFKVMSCTFSAYHALKAEIRAGEIDMHSEGRLKHAWSVFANVCRTEAGDLHENARAFSLPKFIDLLVTGRICCPVIHSCAHQDPQ